jgi:hypothetical protein
MGMGRGNLTPVFSADELGDLLRNKLIKLTPLVFEKEKMRVGSLYLYVIDQKLQK